MIKCRFCDHRAQTEYGEEVCTKYLICLDGISEEPYCKGFETSIETKRVGKILAVVLLVIILLSIVS